MMEGPVLEYPKYSSFIGLYPIPIRHGMTIGELALLFNEKFLAHKVKLTLVPMENWQRHKWFDETALTWLRPSPNLPTFNSAIVYPGQVLLEGTNLSEGRGTTAPFEIFGAPWIDGFKLTKQLNELHLPGVTFHEIWFTPTFSKFQNKLCSGSQIFVTDKNAFQPIATTLALLSIPINFGASSLNESILSLLHITPSTMSQDYVNNKKQFQLQNLITEQRHPKTYQLSYQIENNTQKGLQSLLSVDEDISKKFKAIAQNPKQLKTLQEASAAIQRALLHERTIYLYGTGATGRLAKQVESALWRPFWVKVKQTPIWDKLKNRIPHIENR